MNPSIKIFVAPFCALLLSSCATNFHPPPLSATNPASVEAKESVSPAAKPMLGRDALTQKTNERLAATVPGSPNFEPLEMQHEKTRAVKMDSGDEKSMSGGFYYTCVMHPQIHQEKPGNCPICGMSLIKKEEGAK
jgi:Heavy metal binding domain